MGRQGQQDKSLLPLLHTSFGRYCSMPSCFLKIGYSQVPVLPVSHGLLAWLGRVHCMVDSDVRQYSSVFILLDLYAYVHQHQHIVQSSSSEPAGHILYHSKFNRKDIHACTVLYDRRCWNSSILVRWPSVSLANDVRLHQQKRDCRTVQEAQPEEEGCLGDHKVDGSDINITCLHLQTCQYRIYYQRTLCCGHESRTILQQE